jgi:hypothetical protein
MKVFDIALNEVVENNELELIYDRNVKKYECVCGAIINKQSKLRHEKSKTHIKYLENIKS